MTTRKYSSRSQQTTLAGALTSSATSAIVVSGTGLLGGATISAGETFTVVIDPDTALEEIVDITARDTNTLTIVRGIDNNGTGQAHSAGAVVRHMAIGRDYREANEHIENTTTAHGLTIANVLETTDTDIITTAMLQANAVTTAKIADANVTTAKIADANVTTAKVADSAITSAKIADGTIVAGDIADGAITSAKILDGTIATADIANSAITTAKIADANVTTAKLVDLNVTTDKIADSAITSAKIADGTIATGDIADSAITSAKIANGTIVAGDLADGAVTSDKILNDTIVNADINSAAAIAYSKLNLAGSITSSDIVNGTIVNADVSDTAAIAYTKLSLGGTITSADIVDGTIVNSDINSSAAIALSKLATDPLARANHTGTQTSSTISDFDTQVRTSKVTDLAAPTGSFSMNSQKITTLATPTDAADASTKGYVDAQITALVGGAPGTLDTLKEIADAISAGGSFESTVVLKSGSTMTGALVLNADPSANLGAATKQYVDAVAGSATAAAASAAAAATTYDNFDDRYLGAKSTPPTLDNDGDALIEGAIYWNSVTNQMFAWTGTEWGSISSTADIYRFRFTASGGETSISGIDDNGLTLAYIPGKEQVYLNGVLLARTSDYTATSGSSLTSLSALTAGDILEVITFTAFELADSIARSLFDAKGDILVATSADTPGKLTVGTDGHYLQADSSTSTGLKWSAVSGYSAPTLGSTSIASGATVTNVDGLTINSTTIPSSVTLVSADATQTLTNKTLTTPVVVSPEERTTVSATAATGTVNFDAITQGVLYYTSNASGNWTLNVRGDSGTALNSVLSTGDAITVSFLVTNGGTAYRHTALTIDGSAVTPKWSGGTAPAAGNASSIDAYSFTIVKTASATYTVFGAGPIKYA
jgi:hypothetical protein